MNRTRISHSLMLLTASLIWGIAFVAQQVGMDHVGPLTFTSVRMLIGAAALLPLVLLRRTGPLKTMFSPIVLLGGLLCGLVLCAGTTLQQFALLETSVGKAGFLTALYIVLVPLFALALRRPTGPLVWAGVGLALVGLYCLCMTGGLTLERGDLLLLLCSVPFALHILIIDHFTARVNGVLLSFLQFVVAGLVAGVAMFAFEQPRWPQLTAAWLPLLYSGLLSCGVAYTLQTIGQRGLNPTVASLILSLESVFSVLAGLLILKQTLTAREIVGCAFMFAAILLAQWPARRVPVPFTGTVVVGKRIGHTLSFPTANLALPLDAVQPMPGVYAAYAFVGELRYPAIMNVGKHPTLPEGLPSVEVHLLGYSGDLYGQTLSVEPVRYLRAEEKFPSIDALAQQLRRDARRARGLLS